MKKVARFLLVISCCFFVMSCSSGNINKRNKKLGLSGMKIGMTVKALKQKLGKKLKSTLAYDPSGERNAERYETEQIDQWSSITFDFESDKLVKIFAIQPLKDNAHYQSILKELKKILGRPDDEYNLKMESSRFLMWLWGNGELTQGRVMPEPQVKGNYVLAWFLPANEGEEKYWLILGRGK